MSTDASGPAGFTRWERRWLRALLDAMLPPSPGGLPGLAGLDLAGFWPRFDAAAPPLLGVGLRAATWALTFLGPPLYARRWRPFHRLDADARDLVLAGAARSRSYLARKLVEALRVVACFAWGADPGARRALGAGGEAAASGASGESRGAPPGAATGAPGGPRGGASP